MLRLILDFLEHVKIGLSAISGSVPILIKPFGHCPWSWPYMSLCMTCLWSGARPSSIKNSTKINSFCNQTFDTSFWMYLWQFPSKIVPKPRLHFFTNLYQGTKTRPSDQTWLSQNPTKINSFCNQTFHTSFCIHLWHFPTKIAQKPWLHFFTNFATKAKSQSTQLG